MDCPQSVSNARLRSYIPRISRTSLISWLELSTISLSTSSAAGDTASVVGNTELSQSGAFNSEYVVVKWLYEENEP